MLYGLLCNKITLGGTLNRGMGEKLSQGSGIPGLHILESGENISPLPFAMALLKEMCVLIVFVQASITLIQFLAGEDLPVPVLPFPVGFMVLVCLSQASLVLVSGLNGGGVPHSACVILLWRC